MYEEGGPKGTTSFKPYLFSLINEIIHQIVAQPFGLNAL